MDQPTYFRGNDKRLLLMFSRRSYNSVLLFNLSSEIDMADVWLFGASNDKAFATRLTVSRSVTHKFHMTYTYQHHTHTR